MSVPRIRHSLLAFLALVAISFQVRFSLDAVDVVLNLLHKREWVDLPVTLNPYAPTIEGVKDEAAAAGVSSEDELLAVNGVKYSGSNVLAEAMAQAHPGDLLLLTVRRSSASARSTVVAVPLSLNTSQPPPLRSVLLLLAIRLGLPLLCLALGFWVAAVRPRDSLGWLLCALMLSFAHQPTPDSMTWWTGWSGDAAWVFHLLARYTLPIWMMLFGLHFPTSFAWERRYRWLQWIFIVPVLLTVLVEILFRIGSREDIAFVVALRRFGPITGLVGPLYSLGILVFLGGLALKYKLETGSDARRRLRLLLVGTFLSVMPIVVLTLVASLEGRKSVEQLSPWLVIPGFLSLLFFPVTLAYVIVVQRALEVSVVIRQGVRYALARRGLVVLQAALALMITLGWLSLEKEHGEHSVPRVVLAIVGLALIVMIRRISDRFGLWIDRRFFRDAFNAEQVLNELSDSVRSMIESQTLLKTVADRIAQTLHVPRITVLLCENGVYHSVYALGYNSRTEVAFQPAAATVGVLRRQSEPARVYPEDANSWLYTSKEMTPDERNVLTQLQSELILPLAVKDNLLGFISLSSKRSEEPYSASDVRLLKSVATQTGLALENSQLTAAIAREVAQRERLNRELEIAREVQQRLFPQSRPPVPGLEYAGHCRPALGVGGDYYDYFLLAGSNGKLALTIGDISGKGIGASLMMASLQASLRAQTLEPHIDLAQIIGRINHLLYEASEAHRYATFFYAEYEPESRTLNYVNAGHNPPMLFRCGEKVPIRLEAGGAVIGMLPTCPYNQASLRLAIGDIFVAYTDGISEAMNDNDEEFGEDRLIAAIGSCRQLPPAECLQRVFDVVDEFVAGAPQHDDMTLLVARAV